MLGRAQRMLQLEQEITATLRSEAETLGGDLVVGASTGPGTRLLPSLLVQFHRAHPDVRVVLRIDSTQTVIDRVLERELELGVVGAERQHRSLVYEPWLHDDVVLAVPAGHPFAGRSITLEELRAAPLILQQEGSGVRSVIERELRTAGVRVRDLDVVAELGLQESVDDGRGGGLRRDLHLAGGDPQGGGAGAAGRGPRAGDPADAAVRAGAGRRRGSRRG